MQQLTFKELKRNLKKNTNGLKSIKVALLGDSATQLLNQAIKGYGVELGINFDIFEADYDQIERQVFDLSSDLYKFTPEFIIISYTSTKLLEKFGKLSINERKDFADIQLEKINNLINNINDKLNSKILLFNFSEINDGVYGNYANKTELSFLFQIRKLNYIVMKLSSHIKNIFIVDIAALQNEYGRSFITDNKIFITTDLLWALDFLPILSKNIVDIINSIIGIFKKCLILDLDNTIWGGVIGDDGIEHIEIGSLGIGKAFTELQLWIKQLKERGIILAVCSKNNEDVAKEPFLKHPEMILKLQDISIFVANWKNKADNIKYIQKVLNISFDSMVFLDDNPFERSIVKQNMPTITVPELPEDPAEYLNYIRRLNLFETASYSQEDSQRTKRYQEEATRVELQEKFIDEASFLKSLNMISRIDSFNRFNIPRVSQLTHRSNQFNLRTKRYTEQEIKNISQDNNYYTFVFELKDKFGDSGIISLIIIKKIDDKTLFIDTWIMSCRVLKRTMENFVINRLVRKAKENNYQQIIGEYLPSKKNSMVKNHYANLGFKKQNKLFVLNVNNFMEKETFILKE